MQESIHATRKYCLTQKTIGKIQYVDVSYAPEMLALLLPCLSSVAYIFLFSLQDGAAIWRLRQGVQAADFRTPRAQRRRRGAGASAQPAGRHPLAPLVQPHAHRLGLQRGQLTHPHGPGQHPLRWRDRRPVKVHAHTSIFTVHVAWNTHQSTCAGTHKQTNTPSYECIHESIRQRYTTYTDNINAVRTGEAPVHTCWEVL